jgi:hypothetical protein
MRINPINGLVNRFTELSRVWELYRDSWEQKSAGPEAKSPESSSPPALPKQAMLNPRQGAAFLMRFLSRRQNLSKVSPDDQSAPPGFGTAYREVRKTVEAIPNAALGGSRIKADKPRDRTIAEDAEERPQATTGKIIDTPARTDKKGDLSAAARRAISQRVAVFRAIQRSMNSVRF